ncbi:MAG TPA: hypothetical protein PLS12_09445 [Bacteroidales bacterium]|jgi:iron complex outermembrane receptor protein|nr:hypothetical protein [Bacteroidales bacterium]
MKKNLFFLLYLFLSIISISSIAYSQTVPTDSLFSISFDELMNMKVSSGSKIVQRANEVNAKVKIITCDDIQKRGYNTIDEVLQDLPGFQSRNIQSINSYIF